MFAATHFSPWTRSIPCRSSTVYFTTVQRHRTRPKLSTTTSAHSSSRRSSPDTTTWQTALVAATSAVPHPSPRAVASTIAALDRSGHAEQHALFDLLQREGCTSSPAALDGDDTARDGVHHVKEKHPAAADGDDTAHDDVHHVKEKQATRVELYVTHRPCVSCVCAFVAFQNLAPHCELTVMFDELDGD
eukprot:GEMP01076890.1.p1 GENE.GEMP01076890.1~~GEMP01076890.1.p1  ORF type:complete len:189 (+),score=59.90 GEMP01076890.1:216-782(+)